MEDKKQMSDKINDLIHKTGDYLKTVDVKKIEGEAQKEFETLKKEYKKIDWQDLYHSNMQKLISWVEKCKKKIKKYQEKK